MPEYHHSCIINRIGRDNDNQLSEPTDGSNKQHHYGRANGSHNHNERIGHGWYNGQHDTKRKHYRFDGSCLHKQ